MFTIAHARSDAAPFPAFLIGHVNRNQFGIDFDYVAKSATLGYLVERGRISPRERQLIAEMDRQWSRYVDWLHARSFDHGAAA